TINRFVNNAKDIRVFFSGIVKDIEKDTGIDTKKLRLSLYYGDIFRIGKHAIHYQTDDLKYRFDKAVWYFNNDTLPNSSTLVKIDNTDPNKYFQQANIGKFNNYNHLCTQIFKSGLKMFDDDSLKNTFTEVFVTEQEFWNKYVIDDIAIKGLNKFTRNFTDCYESNKRTKKAGGVKRKTDNPDDFKTIEDNLQGCPYCYICKRPVIATGGGTSSQPAEVVFKGDLEHIIPKLEAYIIGILGCPFNYSWCHHNCNNVKRTATNNILNTPDIIALQTDLSKLLFETYETNKLDKHQSLDELEQLLKGFRQRFPHLTKPDIIKSAAAILNEPIDDDESEQSNSAKGGSYYSRDKSNKKSKSRSREIGVIAPVTPDKGKEPSRKRGSISFKRMYENLINYFVEQNKIFVNELQREKIYQEPIVNILKLLVKINLTNSMISHYKLFDILEKNSTKNQTGGNNLENYLQNIRQNLTKLTNTAEKSKDDKGKARKDSLTQFTYTTMNTLTNCQNPGFDAEKVYPPIED
ncbi:MAG: hypothetical protein EBU66_20195, partial [Bacteroidetes bacterium]|nr:hypothetical protein [Bacteroidota bacterium]